MPTGVYPRLYRTYRPRLRGCKCGDLENCKRCKKHAYDAKRLEERLRMKNQVREEEMKRVGGEMSEKEYKYYLYMGQHTL